jgi:hypothetical protein
MKRFKPMKPGDFVLIVLVVVLSIGTLFAIPALLGDASGSQKTIVVIMDGQEIHRFPLTETSETELIDFPINVGGEEYTATLEVLDGAVRLQRLPIEISPLSIHADIGWIREPYQMIVSLPIRMYITIEVTENGEDIPQEIDTMVY